MFLVPSEPINFQVLNVASDSFELSWDYPKKIPGLLQGFKISVKQEKPLHFIPSDCLYNSKEITLEIKDLNYTSVRVLPDFEYFGVVRAITRVGYGPGANLSFNTLTSGKFV